MYLIDLIHVHLLGQLNTNLFVGSLVSRPDKIPLANAVSRAGNFTSSYTKYMYTMSTKIHNYNYTIYNIIISLY